MGTFAQGTAEWVFRSSCQAGVLIAIVWILQAAMGRRLTPFWRHALWALVLVRLLAPVIPESRWSVFNAFDGRDGGGGRAGRTVERGWAVPSAVEVKPGPDGANVSSAAAPSLAGTLGSDVLREPWSKRVSGPSSEMTGAVGLPLLGSLESDSTVEGPLAHDAGMARDDAGAVIASGWASGLVWLWWTGLVGLMGRLIGQNLAFRARLHRSGVPADRAVRELMDRCRDRMGVRCRVDLVCCAWIQSPAVYGILRPRLLLPLRLQREFSPSELTHVFLHEMAHVRRGDLWLNGLMQVAQLLHWFNPLVWFALERMRHDRELAADALVLAVTGESEARAYGRTILQVLENWVKPGICPATVGILEDPGQLADRMRAIAGYRGTGRSQWWAGLVLLGVSMVALTDRTTVGGEIRTAPVMLEARFAGLKALVGQAGGGSLAGILALPETARLREKILEKGARSAKAWMGESGPGIDSWARLLGWAVDEESLVEIHEGKQGVEGWALALRLDPKDCPSLRETWSRDARGDEQTARSVRVRELKGWTILGVGDRCFEALMNRVEAIGSGSLLEGGSVAEGNADLAKLALPWVPGWKPAGGTSVWPRASWRVDLHGGGLRTRATLTFPRAFEWVLSEWQVPTNQLRDPLVHFLAKRGFVEGFDRDAWFEQAHSDGRSQQVFEWALAGPPWRQYFVASTDDAQGVLGRLADKGAPEVFRLTGFPSTRAEMRRSEGDTRLDLVGIPYFQPFLASTTAGGRPILAGGLSPMRRDGEAAPRALLEQLDGRPNLVSYEWETTGRAVVSREASGVETWGTVGRLQQLKELEQFRHLMRARERGKVPLGARGSIQVPGGQWMDAVAARLGDTITEVTQTGPAELTWVRLSQLGANAEEWVRLLEWMEDESTPTPARTHRLPR